MVLPAMSPMGYSLNRKLIYLFVFLLFYSLSSGDSRSQNVTEVVDLIRKGEIEKARQIVSNFQGEEKSKASTLFLSGLLSTDGDSSAEYYTRLIKKYPNNRYCDDALFRLAQLRYARALYKSALAGFKTILKDYPESPLRHDDIYWIGLCYQAMDQPDSSQKYFEKIKFTSQKTELPELAQPNQGESGTYSPDTQSAPEKTAVQYHLQTGAYTHQTNALMRKSFFEREGYHVEMQTKKIEDKMLYLIWVGTFSNKVDAEIMGDQLKKRYGVEYRIVSE